VIQLTKRGDSVYPGTDYPFRKRITFFLTQGLEKETIAVVKCRYEVISTKIKRKVSMRPAYSSSKKVLVNDKVEAEVKKNRRMISLKETLL
ncbi:hypothetical protein IGI04_001872, partial [Brassica rapa subsp. trilocularis]